MSPYHRRLTKHHLYPTSRGNWRGQNIAEVDEILHYAWHTVFDDAIPEEVISDLLDIWWPDEGYAIRTLVGTNEQIFVRRTQRVPRTTRAISGFEIIFPNPRPLEILKIWLWKWVPDDYFESVSFHAPGLIQTVNPYVVDRSLLDRHAANQQRFLDEAYHRWNSGGHWWTSHTYDRFITRD